MLQTATLFTPVRFRPQPPFDSRISAFDLSQTREFCRVDVHGINVYGINVDARSRCAHYRSTLDIVAIKHHCCGDWYACIECHGALTSHDATVWPKDRFDEDAVLCGSCGARLTINQYLSSSNQCPVCAAAFNPGCSLHHHLYFDVPPSR